MTSGLICVTCNSLSWRDVPACNEPHQTIHGRFIRWSETGVFGRIFVELSRGGGEADKIMIDATHLKAHRTAACLLKNGLFPGFSGEPTAA